MPSKGAECYAGNGERHEVHGGWLTFCVFPLLSCLALCVCGFVLCCAVLGCTVFPKCVACFAPFVCSVCSVCVCLLCGLCVSVSLVPTSSLSPPLFPFSPQHDATQFGKRHKSHRKEVPHRSFQLALRVQLASRCPNQIENKHGPGDP